MCRKIINLVLFCIVIHFQLSQSKHTNNKRGKKPVNQEDDGKSSLVFVFDTTGSMHNDLRQLREGAGMILNTALEESNVIADFVFVPFHDPGVGPATVTRSKQVFKNALDSVQVYGGGDCPEKSLTGIQLALNVSRPRSFLYVFTDATAYDHRLVGKVLDSVQRQQSQVVFVLTGHCNDLQKPSYKVYQQIAAASSGQVFTLNKTNVYKVLEFVRSSIKGRTVNLGSIVNPAGYNHTQGIPVDCTVGEVTVSVSGAKPQIKVVDPSGVQLTGPPKLITTLDLSEIMVVKVMQPEPGNWTITVGSEEDYSVKVVGLSNVTFNHGFSVQQPANMLETSYRPLKGTYNHMMISLTQTDTPVQIDYAEILDLSGKSLFELPMKEVDREHKIYLADAFVPPDDFFQIAIHGRDEFNQELKRISATAIQAKVPDVPYITTSRKVEAHSHSTVILKCKVESLVPVTAMWTRGATKILQKVSSLQTTTIEYVINDMREEQAGTYRCVAKNAAGISKAATEVSLLVDPPQVTIELANTSLEIGDNLTISCTVFSEALLLKFQLFDAHNVTDIHVDPNIDGIYVFNKTMYRVTEKDSGIYKCVAVNRGGAVNQSSDISVNSPPRAHILGSHSISKLIHTDVLVTCRVANSNILQWVAPNGTLFIQRNVSESHIDTLEVKNITEDGVWKCVGLRGSYRDSDSVAITTLIKPIVTIEGPKNISVLNGTTHDIVCEVVAKPSPRILWHGDTEQILNSSITVLKTNVHRSVLTLDSSKVDVGGTYFCFGENSAGVANDQVSVSVRRKMTLIRGFNDKSVELYCQVELHCEVDSYPAPGIRWYHNDTRLNPNNNVHTSEDNVTVFIKRVNFDDLGVYSCEAINGYEKIIVNGTLSVFGLASPLISKDPETLITKKGESIKITSLTVKKNIVRKPAYLRAPHVVIEGVTTRTWPAWGTVALLPRGVYPAERVLEGNPQPILTWQYKNVKSKEFSTLPQNLLNEDDAEITISNICIDDTGVYRCIAENIFGNAFYDVNLIVQYPPQLTSQEGDDKPVEVEAGERVVFSCEATGLPPPLILWTKDGRPVTYSKNIHLTDANDLVIDKASEYDSGLFTCNATSAMGSTHKNFTLLIFVPPKITPPGIEPELEVLEGQLVELPCTVRGFPAPEIEWKQNGNTVTDSRKYAGDFGLRFVANLTDFGNYTCFAKNRYGNTSVSFSLYIWVAPYIDPPLYITKNILNGENVTLQCDVIGFPIPTILWEVNEQMLKENTTSLSFNDRGNFNITNASSNHEGIYVCIAENVAGYASQATYLIVNEPPMFEQNNYTGPYLATEADTALTISCRATGKPKPYVVWSKDEFSLDKDSRYEVDLDGTLTIKSPTEDMSGDYICTAKNIYGNTNRTVPVEIYSLPSQMQSEESYTRVTVLEGTNTSVECPIRASHADTVKWYKDAKLISTGHLKISNISRDNSSTYACVVTNVVGSAHASVAVTVEWPPAFVEKGTEDVQVVRGDDWYCDCGVDAKPAAKTKWFYNSKPLVFEDKGRLRLINLQQRESGKYKCIVSNGHGTITRQFHLSVLVPPFISEFDVLDVVLKEGVNASLECNAVGTPEPSIQWTFNNTHWQLQNSTILSGNTTTLSEGLYRCDARNKAGATHIVYRVSVVAAPRVEDLVAYSDGVAATVDGLVQAVVGSYIRIACKATGKPVPNIQWLRNGNTVSENTPDIAYADLSLDVEASQAGGYTCIVTNEGGVDERRIKLDVLEPPKIFQTLFQNTNASENVINIEVLSGQAFYLHCHPYGNPVPEVYWFKNDLPLKLFDDTMVTTEFGEVIAVKNAVEEQSGNYTCVARNRIGNSSISYLVHVLVPPPKRKENSKVLTSRVGKQLNLTCPVEGAPLPYVMWVKLPYTVISDETPRVLLLNDNYTLIINNTETSDSGKYSCIMTNKVGTTEFLFDVTIAKAPTIAGNVGNSIVEGHVVPLRRSIVLKCEVDGHPLPKISWLKDTQQLSDSVTNIQRVLGNSLLAIWSVAVRDAGQYICVVENEAGTAHRRYNVAVQVPGKWSVWTGWSLCNVTCGLGHQLRHRSCHYVDDYNNTIDNTSKSDKIILDESACKGASNEKRKCHMPPCEGVEQQARWSAWSRWSRCSASCGRGTHSRTRRCRPARRCAGDNVQIRKCPDLPPCAFSERNPEKDNFESKESKETKSYLPEFTYELQPEVIDSVYSPSVEEFYIASGSRQSMVYYDVNVTHNLDHSERGACDPGYRHNVTEGSCDDIDECLVENNNCHSTQVCVNTEGAYRCTCQPGYVSLGAGQRCIDINECEQDIHGCEYACVNVAGGYVCACPRNFRLHTDKHRCYAPSPYPTPYPYEENLEYLSTAVDYPARYKNIRNV